MAKTAERQYLSLMRNILENGELVYNTRTKSNCLTLLNQQIKFSEFPLVTTRKSYWKQAILEMICYIRCYVHLDQFHKLGVRTWDANAAAWNSPDKTDDGEVGLIYGASARETGVTYKQILKQIQQDPHDRGIIWNFWNPEYFDLGCLRPCMFNHHFSVLNNKLYLTSTQRSADVPLGLNFNMVQAWFLLNITAKLTGLEPGDVTINITNCHIYENQIELAKLQVERTPLSSGELQGLDSIDLSTLLVLDNPLTGVSLTGYKYHPEIKYPFTV